MAGEFCNSGVAHKLLMYPTDLSQLETTGCLMTKLGGIFPLLSNVVEKLLRNRISSELFGELKTCCKDARDHVMTGEENLTFIYILTDEGFNTLNSMVVHSNFTEGNLREYTLSIDCMYTDDTDLDMDDIPFFSEEHESQEEFEKYRNGEKCSFRKDKVYMFKVVSKEVLQGVNGFRHKLYEYFIYIPRDQFKRYK